MLTLIFGKKLACVITFLERNLKENTMDFGEKMTKNEKIIQVIRVKIQIHC